MEQNQSCLHRGNSGQPCLTETEPDQIWGTTKCIFTPTFFEFRNVQILKIYCVCHFFQRNIKNMYYIFCVLFIGVHQDCTTLLLLPAALHLLLWITATSEFKIFYILHCFCSAFTHWAYPASTCVFGLLSTKYCILIQQPKSF